MARDAAQALTAFAPTPQTVRGLQLADAMQDRIGMSRSKRRLTRWPRALGLAGAAQWPSAEPKRAFHVIEVDGDVLRAAYLRRRGGELELLGLESFRGRDELATALARLEPFAEGPPRPAVLVTDALAPDSPSRERELPHAIIDEWAAPLARLGVRLERVLPLAGSPLLLLERTPRETVLFLQVERRSIATMKVVAGRCTELDVLHDVEPTAARCLELVDTACPEVLLAGKGLDLSALGYALARSGTTWVSILRPKSGLGVHAGEAHTLGAIFGAARLNCGLVALPALVSAHALDEPHQAIRHDAMGR